MKRITDVGHWFKDTKTNLLIAKRLETPEKENCFTIQEAEEITLQITPRIIRIMRKNIYTSTGHLKVKCAEDEFYVAVSTSSVELPYLKDYTYGRTNDSSEILNYHSIL